MSPARRFTRSRTSRSLNFQSSPGGSQRSPSNFHSGTRGFQHSDAGSSSQAGPSLSRSTDYNGPSLSRSPNYNGNGDFDIPPNQPAFAVDGSLGEPIAHLTSATSLEVDDLIYQAWDCTTSARYNAHVLDFIRFCLGRGLSREQIFPASEDNLCAFVTSMAGKYAGRTIGSKLAGLRAWHIRHKLPWNRGDRLSYAVKGAERIRPASSWQAQRPPITTAMLTKIRDGLDFTNNKDICVWTIATVAFWAQLRLGEILPHAASNYKAESFPTWNGLGEPTEYGSRMLHLPHTKCGGARGEDVVVARQEIDFDPISAFKAHHRASQPMENDLLASYLLPDGRRTILTSRAFLTRINTILTAAGLPRVSGHCFRIGGTTELLLIGIPPHIVKALGRWKSDVFMRYWRSLEILGPRYIEYRPSDPHDNS